LSDYLLGNSDNTRGGITCSLFGSGVSASAHCLRFDPLWYSAYRIADPSVSYNIAVGISAWNDSAGTYYLENLSLSPSQLEARDSLGVVEAQLIGDFATFATPPVLSYKLLLTPSQPPTDPRVLQGVSAWMFVDQTQVDLSGGTCDKIGVSFSAFRNQNNACSQPVGTCLANQPDDLFKVTCLLTHSLTRAKTI